MEHGTGAIGMKLLGGFIVIASEATFPAIRTLGLECLSTFKEEKTTRYKSASNDNSLVPAYHSWK